MAAKGANSKNKAKAEVVETVEAAETERVGEETVSEPAAKYQRRKSSLTPDTYVVVRNGFQGKLVYKSTRTGEVFEWDSFGDEQDMELSELKNARGAHKKYFMNNWWMFDDPEVIEYLGMQQYYKNAISIEEFDELFTKSPDEVFAVCSKLSAGQKKSVAYRARQLIAENLIDSNKVIVALEEALGTELK